MTVPQRLAALRKEMAKRNIAIYIVPTSDFHESEYVGEYFKARAFLTGFTGSTGIAAVTMEKAGLWTDGRYFVQAESQLKDSTVDLYKMDVEGYPTLMEFLEQELQEGQILGFDGRVVNGSWGKSLEELVSKKNGSLYVEEDLVDIIWEDRPVMSKEPVWIFDEKYVGRSTGDKLQEVRKVMEEKRADTLLLSSLYDIAWLLNVRGNDISYVPVVLSYLAVEKEKCIWFVQQEALSSGVKKYLEDNRIEVREYHEFFDFVATLPSEKTVMMDKSVCNYRMCAAIPKEVQVIESVNPTVIMRSLKNKTEVDNTRNAHVKDAVAMCKFMYWLKTNVGKIPMTEISVSDYLEELRKEQEGFLDLSFDTISGYAEHGAIVHYSATPETDKEILPESFLLVDSGGHYLEGTTDITRTFALGEVTPEMKDAFTRVARANLMLANARFIYGATGNTLDVLCRMPFWETNLDYRHGTGHGVGYVLNVHEGPQRIHWRNNNQTLEEGMITTDEPGVYLEGKFGIRLENELVCHKGEKNEYGQFMYFENITYVPFDLDAIDKNLMNETEVRYLNEYHKKVYEVVSPYLMGEELEWLKNACRSI